MSQQGTLSDNTSPAADIEFLTGDVGGAVGPDGAHNVNILGGTGINTVGNPGTNTITINASGGGLTWNREAGAAVAMAVNNGYINTNAGLTTLTLPATAVVGDTLAVMGEGAGGWSIAQNAGQTIQFGAAATTTGVGGSLSSTNRYDTVTLVCRVANTDWSVYNSPMGVLNAI